MTPFSDVILILFSNVQVHEPKSSTTSKQPTSTKSVFDKGLNNVLMTLESPETDSLKLTVPDLEECNNSE